MEAKTITTIDRLQIGDRFYKANDKKKEVWEVIADTTKKTAYQTYRFFAKRDYDRHPTPVNTHTPIVYLRSKIN